MYDVVILCAGAPNPALDLLPSLLSPNERPYIVGVDRGALHLIQQGYSLDYAVGDFDSVSKDELRHINSHTRHIDVYPSEKDDTDMGLGLSHVQQVLAKDAHIRRVYLFGVFGEGIGRIDHLMSNVWLFTKKRYRAILENIQVIESHHRIRFYLAGTHDIANVPADYLSIIGLTPVKQLEIKQAKYTLSARDFDAPVAWISNEFIEGTLPAKISFTDGIVCVMTVNDPNK